MTLRSKLIRLANQKPELRKHLLPLLTHKEADFTSFEADKIKIEIDRLKTLRKDYLEKAELAEKAWQKKDYHTLQRLEVLSSKDVKQLQILEDQMEQAQNAGLDYTDETGDYGRKIAAFINYYKNKAADLFADIRFLEKAWKRNEEEAIHNYFNWKQASQSIKGRRQNLLTQAIRKMLPPLYSQEKVADPIVYVKFFNPYGSGTWLATEFDGKDRFFGAVDLGYGWELGYFSLRELESIEGQVMGRKIPGLQGIERDQWFKPKPLSQAKRS